MKQIHTKSYQNFRLDIMIQLNLEVKQLTQQKNIKSMYQVESIIGKRLNNITSKQFISLEKVQYQVKWANFSAKQSTWMPEQNLKFVKNLIQKYNQQIQMKVSNLISQQKAKKIKKEAPRFSQSLIQQQQQQDQLIKKIGIYEEEQNQTQKKKKKNNLQIDLEATTEINKDLQKQLNQKQLKYREGSRQSQKKSKIVQKVFNKRPQPQIQNKQALVKPQPPTRPKVANDVPPIPPDYQNNRHRYIPPEQIQAQKTLLKKTKLIQKERSIQQPQKKPKGISFWQKHLNKITQKQKEDKIVQNYIKNNSRVIPPPPPPRLLPPQPLSLKDPFKNLSNSQKYSNIPEYSYKYQSSPLDDYSPQGVGHEYHYNTGNLSIKEQKKNLFLQVYSVLDMQRTSQGFIYLSETNEGTKWLVRDDIVPKFSTILVQFYEKHLTFQE